MLGAAATFGVLEIAAGSMPTYWLFALSLIPVGIASMTFITAANSTMQLAVDPVMRGRVMALYMAVFMGGTPFGAPVVGGIAELFGARWSLWLGGGLTLVAAVAGAVLMARARGLVLQASWTPVPALRFVEPVDLDAVR